mmetsp:Transcript_12581/g.34885  ORF Transcript_12581/g.34885 Transcript_12581/m.34885 type:complete len:91 (-) Transcript_12581:4327-4599(-)
MNQQLRRRQLMLQQLMIKVLKMDVVLHSSTARVSHYVHFSICTSAIDDSFGASCNSGRTVGPRRISAAATFASPATQRHRTDEFRTPRTA